jgi:hypothetical protein
MNSKIVSEPATVLNEAGCFPFCIGLQPETTRVIQHLARRHKVTTKGHPPEFLVALLAVKFALANSDQFSKWIDGLCRYQESEGLPVSAHASQLVNHCKKYRKKPLPTNWLPFDR